MDCTWKVFFSHNASSPFLQLHFQFRFGADAGPRKKAPAVLLCCFSSSIQAPVIFPPSLPPPTASGGVCGGGVPFSRFRQPNPLLLPFLRVWEKSLLRNYCLRCRRRAEATCVPPPPPRCLKEAPSLTPPFAAQGEKCAKAIAALFIA